jgi:hypothetical protein
MPIQMLRWKCGAGGDTIMKILLESDRTLHSQNQYMGLSGDRTDINFEYVGSFPYKEIANMSLSDPNSVDLHKLLLELEQLDHDDPEKKWLLKTHFYYPFKYPVIDIVVMPQLIPFVIRACLSKNTRHNGRLTQYHDMEPRIKDPKILYKFDCYNFVQDVAKIKISNEQSIQLSRVLGGWDCFRKELESVNLHVDAKCRDYYEYWLQANKNFFPSAKYISLLSQKNYDYNENNLSIEEKYCLLVLAGKKFKILK